MFKSQNILDEQKFLYQNIPFEIGNNGEEKEILLSFWAFFTQEQQSLDPDDLFLQCREVDIINEGHEYNEALHAFCVEYANENMDLLPDKNDDFEYCDF
jgi:hypothetical protein